MEEESLKERSAVIRVQVPLAIGAFLLNEKRSDLADIESRTGTHIVIIPNMNLETPITWLSDCEAIRLKAKATFQAIRCQIWQITHSSRKYLPRRRHPLNVRLL